VRNVYLDLGTHHGQGLNEFIHRFQMNDTWIIHTFEANPITFETYINQYHSSTPWVIAHNKAISDNDGEVIINLETVPTGTDDGMGSSIIDMKYWNPWNLREREYFKKNMKVQSINLSKFIKDNFNKDDNIVMKMDIEGSEYSTLEKMIEDDTISYLNFLTVEWHSAFFENKDEIIQRENEILEKLKKYSTLRLESWK